MTRGTTRQPLRQRVLDALQAHGPVTVPALRDFLRVRRKTLFATLAELCADGSAEKGSQERIGADSRPRRITVYSVPKPPPMLVIPVEVWPDPLARDRQVQVQILEEERPRELSVRVWVSDASGGGSRPQDDGSQEASESDAAADLEFSGTPPDCPGCSLTGGGPNFCSECRRSSP